MKYQLFPGLTLRIEVGDITSYNVDVIVNAANSSLLGGGGVDGAIHTAGGIEIFEACMDIREGVYPAGLPTGNVVKTIAGNLPAKFVFHTVGPIYHSDPDHKKHLTDCYRNSLTLASELGVNSIAFPSISTGIYGYPKKDAALVTVNAIRKFVRVEFTELTVVRSLEDIYLVAFSQVDADILCKIYDA